MAHKVEFFRDRILVGISPSDESLEDTKLFARDGMLRLQADFARIVDMDGSGAEIWSERRDAKLPDGHTRSGVARALVPEKTKPMHRDGD